jgi:hypothetical protein
MKHSAPLLFPLLLSLTLEARAAVLQVLAAYDLILHDKITLRRMKSSGRL